MLKRVLIFRHGETDYNREGRFQGHLDVGLNATGRAQVRELVPVVRGFGAEAILSSDLSRAYESARIITRPPGIPVFVREGLREAYLGDAQGLTIDQISAKFGLETLSRWRSILPTDADFSYPGGESGSSVMTRVFSALEGFLKEAPYQSIAVASHGGVIRRIMQRVLGDEKVPIPNAVVYVLEFNILTGAWRVLVKPS